MSLFLYGKDVHVVCLKTRRMLYTLPYINVFECSEEISTCFCCLKYLDEEHDENCFFQSDNIPFSQSLILANLIVEKIDCIKNETTHLVCIWHVLLVECTVCLATVEHYNVVVFQCGHGVCLDCFERFRNREICAICRAALTSVTFLGQRASDMWYLWSQNKIRYTVTKFQSRESTYHIDSSILFVNIVETDYDTFLLESMAFCSEIISSKFKEKHDIQITKSSFRRLHLDISGIKIRSS